MHLCCTLCVEKSFCFFTKANDNDYVDEWWRVHVDANNDTFPLLLSSCRSARVEDAFQPKIRSVQWKCSLIPWTINARLNLPSSIIEGYSSTQIMTKKLTQTKILVQTRADKYLVLENDFKLWTMEIPSINGRVNGQTITGA